MARRHMIPLATFFILSLSILVGGIVKSRREAAKTFREASYRSALGVHSRHVKPGMKREDASIQRRPLPANMLHRIAWQRVRRSRQSRRRTCTLVLQRT